MIDVNAFLGAYPWRRVPGTSPEALLAAMDRVGIAEAWVSHLPGLFWKDPAAGNPWLYEVAGPGAAIPRGGDGASGAAGVGAGPRSRRRLAGRRGRAGGPGLLGLGPGGPEMLALVRAAGASRACRCWPRCGWRMAAGATRSMWRPNWRPGRCASWLRAGGGARVIITHADRGFIEEVHYGSTPAESARVWWDVSWVWGPPEDHLARLLATIGPGRFLFGSGQPLRLAETPGARLDLLPLSPADRAAITHDNAAELLRRRSPDA